MPKIIEVNASASLGGKVQIVDYKINSDFHLSMSERWNVEDLSEEDAAQFRRDVLARLMGELEPVAQAEFDSRFELMAGN